MTADTSASVGDLRAFERDLLYAVRALERDNDTPPKGLAIKAYLDEQHDDDLNHSRLYQNLDQLIKRGLLRKGKKDDRTNEYATTDRTRTLLEAFARRRARQTGVELEIESAPDQIDPDHVDATEETESVPEQTNADVTEREGES
ncbi:helix-turn-helix transcriptional regulator [Halorussus salinus]|uniref:helix-turn-helix transcriptional regulator n=1 Tax=Halorussus salinus TaxID=1364935 RepID=UPI001092307B|nr:helix-turn-helix transcriptional regulator [Halorussus salinus]